MPMSADQLQKVIQGMADLIKEWGEDHPPKIRLLLLTKKRGTGGHYNGQPEEEIVRVYAEVGVEGVVDFNMTRRYIPAQAQPVGLGSDRVWSFFTPDEVAKALEEVIRRNAGVYQAKANRCQQALGALAYTAIEA